MYSILGQTFMYLRQTSQVFALHHERIRWLCCWTVCACRIMTHSAFALTIHAGRNALAQVKVEALLISNLELTLKRKQAPMCLFLNELNGVTDGARTHDNQNHNLKKLAF